MKHKLTHLILKKVPVYHSMNAKYKWPPTPLLFIRLESKVPQQHRISCIRSAYGAREFHTKIWNQFIHSHIYVY